MSNCHLFTKLKEHLVLKTLPMRWNKRWALAKRGGGGFYKHEYNKEHPMDSKFVGLKCLIYIFQIL